MIWVHSRQLVTTLDESSQFGCIGQLSTPRNTLPLFCCLYQDGMMPQAFNCPLSNVSWQSLASRDSILENFENQVSSRVSRISRIENQVSSRETNEVVAWVISREINRTNGPSNYCLQIQQVCRKMRYKRRRFMRSNDDKWYSHAFRIRCSFPHRVNYSPQVFNVAETVAIIPKTAIWQNART